MYNNLIEAILCGCWAHVRRKFAEALPMDKSLLADSAAARGVKLCNEIFILERELEGKDADGRITREPLTANERQNQRQERLKPILDGLFAWLNELPVSGGTKLAKAVQYCFNEKTYLYRCLEDGNIPVDNNRAENAIRPFVVGRKNYGEWTECGGILYTLMPFRCLSAVGITNHIFNGPPRCKLGGFLLRFDAGLFGGYVTLAGGVSNFAFLFFCF